MAPWLDGLRDRLGEREIPGPQHNPIIVNWGQIAGINWWNNDEDAWCAVAVNGVLVEAGYPSTKSALAQSFRKYGTQLAGPVPGAIGVMPRGSKSWQGHVGIVEKVNDDGTVTLIDGNSSNMVKRTRYKISTFFADGWRWPPGAEIPPAARSGAQARHTDYNLGDRLIQHGDHGEDVEELQVALETFGYMANDPDIASFGDGTDLAVRQFQRDNKLSIDGIVGPATAGALKAELAQRRAKQDAKKRTRDTAAPTAIGTGAVGGAVAAVQPVLEQARGLQSLSTSETFGLVVASVVLIGVVGFGIYWFIQRREQRTAEAVE